MARSVGDEIQTSYGPGTIESINGDRAQIRLKTNGELKEFPLTALRDRKPPTPQVDWSEVRRQSAMSTGAARAFGVKMNPEMMKRFGLADGAQPSEKFAAYAAKCFEADDAACMAAADDLEAMSADKPDDDEEAAKMRALAVRLRKMAAPVEAMGDLTVTHEGEEEEEAPLATLAADLNLPAQMSRAARNAAIRESVIAMRATTIPRDEVKTLKDEIATLKARNAETDAKACDAKVQAFARAAIDAGRWDPDGAPALLDLVRANLPGHVTGEARAMSAIGAVEKYLKPAGFWRVMGHITANGHPIGTDNIPANFSSGAVAMHRTGNPAADEYNAALSKVKADRKVDHATAMSIIGKEQPHLLAALRQ